GQSDRVVVGDAGADYDGVADDGRRRSLFVVGKAVGLRTNAQAAAQVDGAVVPAIGARLARGGIDCDQARVDGGKEDPALAGRRLPGGDAAVHEVAITRSLG